MKDSDFLKALDSAGNFQLRRAAERLREGLFDPMGVQLLTSGETHLNRVFDRGVRELNKHKAAHLCICGAYGQGKSHSLTYLRNRALGKGFVTSQINLDPREIPFHNFQQVYRALVTNIQFPDMETSLADCWKIWADQFKSWEESPATDNEQLTSDNEQHAARLLEILPDEIPHFFRTVLTALALETVSLSKHERRLKKHAAFRPHEFPYLLGRSLIGEAIPVYRLKPAFRYREVFFYKDASLLCRGWQSYLGMIFGLSRLFQEMGFKGWVLLFDEGEAITQTPINSRSKSYQILHRIFAPETPVPGFYPVFAFTDDFFMQVREEDYDRIRLWRGEESLYFDQDYGHAWRNLVVHRLQDLSSKEWINLSTRLMLLHARAYGWEPPKRAYQQMTRRRLSETKGQEARLKIKALVDQLDLVHQDEVLGNSS